MKRSGGPAGHGGRSVYTFLLLSYITVLLITLTSSIVFYSRISRQITAKTELSKELLLSQLREDWERNTREMERLVNELAFNRTLEQFAKGIQDSGAPEIQAMLSSVRGEDSRFLIDCFVYIGETKEILTPTLRMDARRFFNIMYPFVDMDFAELRESLLEASSFQAYLPVRTVNQYGETERRVMFYVQTFPVSMYRSQLGQVICLIDADEVSASLERLYAAANSSVYLIDREDRVLLSNADAPRLTQEAMERLAAGGSLPDSMVTVQESERQGWRFVLSTPRALYLAENRSFLLWTLAVAAAYFLVGLLIIRFLTERSYRPIREISSLIRDKIPLGGGKNEFETIREALLSQYQDREKLSEMLESQRPFVVREMFSQLLTGMVRDYGEWKKHLENVGVRFDSDVFLMVSVEIDENSRFFEEGTGEESLLLARLIAQNVGCELFGKSFLCQYLEIGRTFCTFLLNLKEGADRDRMSAGAKELTGQLAEFASHYQLLFYAGISDVHQGLRSVQLCYDESRKSVEHSRLWADMPIVTFDALENLDLDYYYPSETEVQLLSALRTGDYERARTLIDSIFETNAREKNIGVNAARSLIAEMSATLHRVLGGMRMPADGPPPAVLDLDRYLLNPSLESAKADINAVIDRLDRQQAERRVKNKTEKLADAVAAYIRDHAEDPGLDLNLLSRQFQMTPQYISNSFKRYKNENIKDYISKLRLEKAKELLRTTDAPVKEIAQRLGYAGEIGIIRLFKRYEQTTPGEYRSLHRQT